VQAAELEQTADRMARAYCVGKPRPAALIDDFDDRLELAGLPSPRFLGDRIGIASQRGFDGLRRAVAVQRVL
jgi:hypothetical protein